MIDLLPDSGLPPPVEPADATMAGEVASAGRSCLVILVLAVVLVLVVCVGVAARWALAG